MSWFGRKGQKSKNDEVAGPLSGGESNNPDKDQREWFEAKELAGTKRVGDKRYYKVVWANSKDLPTWEKAEDISEFLIRNYHLKHTLGVK